MEYVPISVASSRLPHSIASENLVEGSVTNCHSVSFLVPVMHQTIIILTCKAISGYPWTISIISMSFESTNQRHHFNLRGFKLRFSGISVRYEGPSRLTKRSRSKQI